jgi:hypothetical protein
MDTRVVASGSSSAEVCDRYEATKNPKLRQLLLGSIEHLRAFGREQKLSDAVGAHLALIADFAENRPGVALDGWVMDSPYCTADYDFALPRSGQ